MQIYQVGGSVRDKLCGRQPQDYDYVVTGSSPEEMLSLGFVRIGKDFPVFLHPESKEEYALARKEIKTGCGHKDFRFIFDPTVTLEEDLKRRDFTCNAIAYNPQSGEYIDPFNGQQDIQKRILRHINAQHFQEDPLRILRLCRFTAQLGFTPAPETLALVTQMTASGQLSHLSPERIWKELEKALHCPHFPNFINVARRCGALKIILPEVEHLWATPKHNDNCGDRTLAALNQAADGNALVRFAILLQLMGENPAQTENVFLYQQHQQNASELIKGICRRLKIPNRYRDFALIACRHYGKLSTVLETQIDMLVDFCEELMHTDIENFVAVCRADMHSRKQPVSAAQTALFEKNALLIRQVTEILQTIRATDMPNWKDLPKDQSFHRQYRAYRINRVRKMLHPVSQ